MSQESEKVRIWGPSAGSAVATIQRDRFDRLILDLTTDFAKCRGVFHKETAQEQAAQNNQFYNISS